MGAGPGRFWAPVTYKLKDLDGDHIKDRSIAKSFRWCPLSKPDYALFDIDRIVKTRKRAGKVEYLVKWRGYPEKFNSWSKH